MPLWISAQFDQKKARNLVAQNEALKIKSLLPTAYKRWAGARHAECLRTLLNKV
jgi:hypothetical protein